MAPEELSYRVKYIKFKGEAVPVLLQDVNGPCPLLAISNGLLLRGQLRLPAGVEEVSEERLVQLVVGHLLDANSLDGREVSEEYRLNLQHNLADAMALLPKLTTGIDVNLRFHDIRGFEFTNEVAVFDLLGMSLVHGWLCDPQDEATACALGQKSYNELVMQLVTTLGGEATPKRVTPTPSFRAQQQQQQQSGAAAGVEQQGSGKPPIDAAALAEALHSSLQALPGSTASPAALDGTEAAPQPAPPAPSAASPAAASPSALPPPGSMRSSLAVTDSMRVLIDEMMAGLVQDTFSPTPTHQASSPISPSAKDFGEAAAAEEAAAAPPLPPLPPHAAGTAATLRGWTAEPGGDEERSLCEGPHELPPVCAAPIAGMSWDGVLQLGSSSSGSSSGLASTTGGTATDASSSMAPTAGLESPSLVSPPGAESVALVLRCSTAEEEEAAAAGAEERPVQVELRLLPLQPTAHQSAQPLSPFNSLSFTPGSIPRGQAEPEVEESTANGRPAAAAAAAAAEEKEEQEREPPAAAAAAAEVPAVPAAEPPAAAGGLQAEAAPAGSGAGRAGAPDEGAVHDALLIQQFLEGAPSQLTWHGLQALHDGLPDGQLVVFFRNNHFNTMLKHEGGLYILATDQGYQYEPDVVWEHLVSVDGDTLFVDSKFQPFVPHAEPAGAAAGGAVLAGLEADAASGARAQEDADLALALALQQEEHDRADREARQRSAPEVQQGQQQRARPAAPGARSAAQQQGQPGGSSSRSDGSGHKLKKKLKEECSLM